jgi:hypothetical protein
LSLRDERYLGGDLKDAVAIGFDFGIRHALSLHGDK